MRIASLSQFLILVCLTLGAASTCFAQGAGGVGGNPFRPTKESETYWNSSKDSERKEIIRLDQRIAKMIELANKRKEECLRYNGKILGLDHLYMEVTKDKTIQSLYNPESKKKCDLLDDTSVRKKMACVFNKHHDQLAEAVSDQRFEDYLKFKYKINKPDELAKIVKFYRDIANGTKY